MPTSDGWWEPEFKGANRLVSIGQASGSPSAYKTNRRGHPLSGTLSQATSPCDGTTARRCPCLRTGSRITEARPHSRAVPRPEPHGRKGPPAFPLCHKVSGPFRSLAAVPSQWTQGGEIDLMEKRQNKAGCSGVCRFHIRTHDKKVRSSTRALMAAET